MDDLTAFILLAVLTIDCLLYAGFLFSRATFRILTRSKYSYAAQTDFLVAFLMLLLSNLGALLMKGIFA